MMKRDFFVSLFALVLLFVASAGAHAADPVKWTAAAKMTSDTEGVVTLSASIDEGWHLYGVTMPADGPSATKLYYGATGAEFITNVSAKPKAISKYDDMFGTNLTYWENSVTFTRKFKLAGPKDKAKIKVKVAFMCCNDANCRPPKTQEFDLSVE